MKKELKSYEVVVVRGNKESHYFYKDSYKDEKLAGLSAEQKAKLAAKNFEMIGAKVTIREVN